jgi:hypothetical protein
VRKGRAYIGESKRSRFFFSLQDAFLLLSPGEHQSYFSQCAPSTSSSGVRKGRTYIGESKRSRFFPLFQMLFYFYPPENISHTFFNALHRRSSEKCYLRSETLRRSPCEWTQVCKVRSEKKSVEPQDTEHVSIMNSRFFQMLVDIFFDIRYFISIFYFIKIFIL